MKGSLKIVAVTDHSFILHFDSEEFHKQLFLYASLVATFNSRIGTWTIDESILDSVVNLGKKYFAKIIIKRSLVTVDPQRKSALATLYLADDAPSFLIDKVVKVLSERYHPDNLDTGNRGKFEEVRRAKELLS